MSSEDSIAGRAAVAFWVPLSPPPGCVLGEFGMLEDSKNPPLVRLFGACSVADGVVRSKHSSRDLGLPKFGL